MSRIAARFAELRSEGRGALVTFVTAGDPELNSLPSVLAMLVQAGADVVEVGIPFSDPIADGPTIQASSQRALDRGMNARLALEQIAAYRLQDQSTPIVLMGYMNTILRLGFEQFANEAAGAGVDGTIVCDLTPEEAGEWIEASRTHGLDNIFLVAPTSTDERIALAAKASTGFVYAVSRTGVTGGNAELSSPEALVSRVKSSTQVPVCVGFGISNRPGVETAHQYADGAIVGSAIVECMHRQGIEETKALVRSLAGG
ncbi:MAG TPA: tryptophan synthase subunit alpha [Fimbriimonadaceae bacterium]|nr:tryptophan synthase subunit alpha [Fimbriimonadaceae bacterium]